MIKVGSDFSGVGAFNQALIRLGIEYDEVFACDMDKYARETFIHNYGEPKYYPKDVYEREIPKESLDIYMTSPPCQAFSLAGKRKGKEDKRGILFFNSHKFIKENKPRYFIFENVKGLLSDDNGNTFSEWVNLLGGKSVNGSPVLFPYEDSVPYHIYSKVMNAKKHGVPQNRERVFIIGIRDDADNNFRWAKEEHLTKRLKDVLENEVNEKYFLSDTIINGFLKHKERHEEKQTGFKWQPKNENDTANTLRANAALCPTDNTIRIADYRNDEGLRIRKDNCSPCVNSHLKGGEFNLKRGQQDLLLCYKNNIRRLTPRECFRLMDFPDTFTWTCSDSQAYKQAGNSIVVRCLELIIKQFNLNAEM
tara:strand:+ start:42 stop:1133 length:1092 start_codon:yes stop_codon:yes gene_type:complete